MSSEARFAEIVIRWENDLAKPRRRKKSDTARQALKLDLTPAPLSEETLAAARLAVCGQASDVDEARELLEMLGLMPDE